MEGKITHVRFGGFAFAAGTPGGPRLMEAMFKVVRVEPSCAVEVLVRERADVEVVVLLPRS